MLRWLVGPASHAAAAACTSQRLISSPQRRAAVQQDTLLLPIYIVEDIVRKRLRTKITR